MNDPEVIMYNAISTTGLAAHSEALEAAGAAINVVIRLPAALKPISDRVIRSATPVPANLAEGHGRSDRDRLLYWRIAYASAKEVDSHLRLLAATVSRSSVQATVDTFDRVRAMTWRLLNPYRRYHVSHSSTLVECRGSSAVPITDQSGRVGYVVPGLLTAAAVPDRCRCDCRCSGRGHGRGRGRGSG